MIRQTLAFALVLTASTTLTASAEVPATGIFAAVQSDERAVTTIYRLKPTGIEKLAVHRATMLTESGWSDASTLWVLDSGDDKKLKVAKFVDGKLADTIEVTPGEWKFAKMPEELAASLYVTASKQVWLQHCEKRNGDQYNLGPCVKGVYLRVDTKPIIRATSKPKQIDAYRTMANLQEGTPKPFPAAKAPAGFSVKLTTVVTNQDGARKVKGAVCTGPSNATATWPGPDEDLDYAMKPKKVTWLRTSPPFARIEGKATNPIGFVFSQEAYFLGCTELVNRAEFFGNGLWGISRGSDKPTWSIYLDDKLLGTVPGEELRIAPN